MTRRVRGTVKSNKMDKTVSVVVERRVKDRRYGKYVKRASTFKAHDAHNAARPGDLVEIEESRPLSKTKCWRLVRIVKRGSALRAGAAPEEIAAELTPSEPVQ